MMTATLRRQYPNKPLLFLTRSGAKFVDASGTRVRSVSPVIKKNRGMQSDYPQVFGTTFLIAPSWDIRLHEVVTIEQQIFRDERSAPEHFENQHLAVPVFDGGHSLAANADTATHSRNIPTQDNANKGHDTWAKSVTRTSGKEPMSTYGVLCSLPSTSSVDQPASTDLGNAE